MNLSNIKTIIEDEGKAFLSNSEMDIIKSFSTLRTLCKTWQSYSEINDIRIALTQFFLNNGFGAKSTHLTTSILNSDIVQFKKYLFIESENKALPIEVQKNLDSLKSELANCEPELAKFLKAPGTIESNMENFKDNFQNYSKVLSYVAIMIHEGLLGGKQLKEHIMVELPSCNKYLENHAIRNRKGFASVDEALNAVFANKLAYEVQTAFRNLQTWYVSGSCSEETMSKFIDAKFSSLTEAGIFLKKVIFETPYRKFSPAYAAYDKLMQRLQAAAVSSVSGVSVADVSLQPVLPPKEDADGELQETSALDGLKESPIVAGNANDVGAGTFDEVTKTLNVPAPTGEDEADDLADHSTLLQRFGLPVIPAAFKKTVNALNGVTEQNIEQANRELDQASLTQGAPQRWTTFTASKKELIIKALSLMEVPNNNVKDAIAISMEAIQNDEWQFLDAYTEIIVEPKLKSFLKKVLA